MIISHRLRTIFIGNPKTASRSIDIALSQFQDEPEISRAGENSFYTGGHMPAATLQTILDRPIWEGYFKFAFVRNPWDWFISQHFYNLQKHGVAHRVDQALSTEDIRHTYRFLRLYRGVPWAVSASQHGFLCNEGGRVLVDFLGRFERLEEDFLEIQSRIGVKLTLPHVNSSAHRQYHSYYEDDTRALVGSLYARDIQIFGYEF